MELNFEVQFGLRRMSARFVVKGKCMTKRWRLFILIFFTIGISGCAFIYSFIGLPGQLRDAIWADDKEKVKRILEKCSAKDVNSLTSSSVLYFRVSESMNFYPLQEACRMGNPEIVQLLLDAGADVNVTDPSIHSTPLICALKSSSGERRFEIAEMLIERGADINVTDDRGDSPLKCVTVIGIYATSEMKEKGGELFIYLVEACETIEIDEPYNDYNLIEYASYHNNIIAVQYLLENGDFGINDTTGNGRTILHVAAQAGELEMCTYLLENGADKEMKDSEGKRAYDYALEKGREKVLELLQ